MFHCTENYSSTKLPALFFSLQTAALFWNTRLVSGVDCSQILKAAFLPNSDFLAVRGMTNYCVLFSKIIATTWTSRVEPLLNQQIITHLAKIFRLLAKCFPLYSNLSVTVYRRMTPNSIHATWNTKPESLACSSRQQPTTSQAPWCWSTTQPRMGPNKKLFIQIDSRITTTWAVVIPFEKALRKVYQSL